MLAFLYALRRNGALRIQYKYILPRRRRDAGGIHSASLRLRGKNMFQTNHAAPLEPLKLLEPLEPTKRLPPTQYSLSPLFANPSYILLLFLLVMME